MNIETATDDHGRSRSSADNPALQFVTFEVLPLAGGQLRLSTAGTYLDENSFEFLSDEIESISASNIEEVLSVIRQNLEHALQAQRWKEH